MSEEAAVAKADVGAGTGAEAETTAENTVVFEDAPEEEGTAFSAFMESITTEVGDLGSGEGVEGVQGEVEEPVTGQEEEPEAVEEKEVDSGEAEAEEAAPDEVDMELPAEIREQLDAYKAQVEGLTDKLNVTSSKLLAVQGQLAKDQAQQQAVNIEGLKFVKDADDLAETLADPDKFNAQQARVVQAMLQAAPQILGPAVSQRVSMEVASEMFWSKEENADLIPLLPTVTSAVAAIWSDNPEMQFREVLNKAGDSVRGAAAKLAKLKETNGKVKTKAPAKKPPVQPKVGTTTPEPPKMDELQRQIYEMAVGTGKIPQE